MNLTWVFLIYLVVNVIFGFITLLIAKNKLRSPGFFWLGFFFGFIGIIIVLIIEDYRNFLIPLNVSVVNDELFHNDKKISREEFYLLVAGYKSNGSNIISNNSQNKLETIEKELTKIDELYAKGQIDLEEKNKLRKEVLDSHKNN